MRPTSWLGESANLGTGTVRYAVRVYDKSSAGLSGVLIEAPNADAARAVLHARGLAAVSVEQASGASITGSRHLSGLGTLIHELAAMVGAGLGVAESLEALLEMETDAAMQGVIRSLLADLNGGLRLSQAMRQQPQAFAPLLSGLVEASELTGDVAGALRRYIAYDERLGTLRHQVRSATLYPVVLLVVGGAVALFLLGWVVPRFAAVFDGAGRDLPWASKWLLALGRSISDHAAYWILGALACGALVAWVARSWRVAAGLGAWAVLIPGVRQWVQRLDASRLYLTLGLLLDGGVPLHPALALAATVMPPARQGRLRGVRNALEQGSALSAALGAQGLLTPVAARFLQAGERSGQLAHMLAQAAAFHELEATRWLQRFGRLVEPVLMIGIGCVIGGIVLLLYMPVFDLAGTLP